MIWMSLNGIEMMVSGTYSNTSVLIGSSSADKFVLFDADGDGDLDIACGYSVPYDYFFSSSGKTKSLSLFTNDGDGNFTKSSISTNSYIAPVDIKAGDMDGDGLDDIIITNAWDRNPIYNIKREFILWSITWPRCSYYRNGLSSNLGGI